MHGRKPLALALGLMVGLAGCQGLPGARLFSGAKKPADDVVHKPSTYVAFADYRAHSGFAKELPEPAQLQYREESRLSYLKAIEVDEKCLPAHLGLARLLTNWEKHADAVEAYRKAIELSPADAGLWYELGMCQCRQRQWEEATANLAKAVELAPAQRSYRAHLGLALARAGRHTEGLAQLTQAVGEAQANYDLARLFDHTRQPALARHYAHQALCKDPNLAGARALLAPPAPDAPATSAAPEVRTVSHQTGASAPQPQIITPRGDAGKQETTVPAPLPPGLTETAKPAIPVPPRPVIGLRGR